MVKDKDKWKTNGGNGQTQIKGSGVTGNGDYVSYYMSTKTTICEVFIYYFLYIFAYIIL